MVLTRLWRVEDVEDGDAEDATTNDETVEGDARWTRQVQQKRMTDLVRRGEC